MKSSVKGLGSHAPNSSVESEGRHRPRRLRRNAGDARPAVHVRVLPRCQTPRAGAALAGANAAVVGILGAALYTPVFTAGVSGVITLSIAVVCYAAPTSWKVPPWAVVIGAALVGWIVL